MIKENQQFLNRINVLSDALIIYLMIPVSFWIRFTLQQGVVNVTLRDYLIVFKESVVIKATLKIIAQEPNTLPAKPIIFP